MMDLIIVINIGDGDIMMVWVVMNCKTRMEGVIILKDKQEREN